MTSQPHLTRHASVRSQQRSIPPLIVDWLVRYGTRQAAQDSASILFFDKASRRRLAHDVGLPILRALAPMLDAYIVQAADDVVITVGWRAKRVLRDRKYTSEKPAAQLLRHMH